MITSHTMSIWHTLHFKMFLKSASELDLHHIYRSQCWQNLWSLCLITRYYKRKANKLFPSFDTISTCRRPLVLCSTLSWMGKIPCLPPTTVLHPSLVHSCELFSTVIMSLDLTRLSECRKPSHSQTILYASIKGVKGPFLQWSAISDTDLAEK